MSTPRHLWSGNWELESAAAAEERAQRRVAPEEHPETPPPSPPPRSTPSTVVRAIARLRSGRALAMIILLTLLSAGATYAVVSALVGGGAQPASSASRAPAWLGVDTTSYPLGSGAMVIDVTPGSPAEQAGLEPGDVITQIDNRRIGSPADIGSAITGMHSGETVEVGYIRGPITYTTQVTLTARHGG